jgi:hypothetical protein
VLPSNAKATIAATTTGIDADSGNRAVLIAATRTL